MGLAKRLFKPVNRQLEVGLDAVAAQIHQAQQIFGLGMAGGGGGGKFLHRARAILFRLGGHAAQKSLVIGDRQRRGGAGIGFDRGGPGIGRVLRQGRTSQAKGQE